MDSFAANAAALGDDERIAAILRQLCDLTHMGFAAVARVTEARWVACQVEDRIEFGLDPGGELEIKKTICDEIRASGQAVIIDHIGADPDWRTHPVPAIYGFESYVALPLFLADGSFFGTLCAIDPEPRTLEAPEMVARFRAFAAEIEAILAAKDAAGLIVRPAPAAGDRAAP